jgi:hypothetical protein
VGTPTDWSAPIDAPALDVSPDCRRFDGWAVTARGMRHDADVDAFHWYYTAQTHLTACADNADPWYDNPSQQASYIGHAINVAPVVGLDTATAAFLGGTVADTFPAGVIVTASSDLDGYLGAATVAPAGGPGVVETTWALPLNPGLSPGVHEITVEAVDEGGVARSLVVLVGT